MEEKQRTAGQRMICELACERKGYIRVSFDFERGLAVWDDSNRWQTSFVRSIPEEALEAIRVALMEAATAAEQPSQDETGPCYWELRLCAQKEERVLAEGWDLETPTWRRIGGLIEELLRRPMVL